MGKSIDIISCDNYDRNVVAIYSHNKLKTNDIYYSPKHKLSFIPIIEIKYSDKFKYLSKLNNKET